MVPIPTGTLSITAGSSSITSGQGQQVTLTASSVTNAVQANLVLAEDDSVVYYNFTSIQLSPTVTTGYKLRVVNSLGYYVDSNIITITVVPAPTGTLSIIAGFSSITSGQSVTLRSLFTNGTATINDASQFNSVTVTNNGTYTISPTSTTTYTLRVTNSIGFAINSIITITVVPMPTATLSITAGSSSITSGQGQEVTLRSLFTNGTATIYDNASPFNGVAITNNGTYIVSPTVTTTYTLRVTNSLGYYVDSSVTITVSSGTGYFGKITFKLRVGSYGSDYPANTTYNVTMYYGNQTFTSNNNSVNVSHTISEENRLENANSIITITPSINSIGNVYAIESTDFYYNNEIKNWSEGGNQYKIPQNVADVPLDFIINVAVRENDD